MQLEIAPDATEVLADVLDRALGDTREEIYKTEVAEYKVALKKREAVLVSLLQRLKSPTAN